MSHKKTKNKNDTENKEKNKTNSYREILITKILRISKIWTQKCRVKKGGCFQALLLCSQNTQILVITHQRK